MATTTSSLRLNLSSIKIPDIPTAQEALVAAREIIADTEGNGENFVPGPVYHINPGRKYQELGVGIQVVETLSRSVSPPDPKWFMRVSRHGPADGLFDEFWDGLGLDHLAKEAKYNPDCSKVTKLKVIEEGVREVWHISREGSAFIAPRTFTNLLVFIPPTNRTFRKEGYVISMPLDSTGDKELQEAERAAGTGIKGRYVAIVRLRALDDGRTEWNDPSGMIPRSLVERGFPETLAHGVPNFVKWLKDGRPDKPSLDQTPSIGRVWVYIVPLAIAFGLLLVRK